MGYKRWGFDRRWDYYCRPPCYLLNIHYAYDASFRRITLTPQWGIFCPLNGLRIFPFSHTSSAMLFLCLHYCCLHHSSFPLLQPSLSTHHLNDPEQAVSLSSKIFVIVIFFSLYIYIYFSWQGNWYWICNGGVDLYMVKEWV